MSTTAKTEKLGKYLLGDCIGKGAFGAVFKALNTNDGTTVAIKKVKLGKMQELKQNTIMSEIELLKKLNHPNIVKYIAASKKDGYLYIVLEYVENGSLQGVLKRFGQFPETLVAVYIVQVLDGLLYLHDQGVIHRDIKGANILTTKEGHVKLADFGVATKLADIDEAAVVGTPYWMAPEIIELSGSTTASDIWSVGCTVIELLTGVPPYFELPPMPALFRIVQDDHPPLPEGLSGALRDFLLQCFQKDPNLRVSARKLLRHAWLQAVKKQSKVQRPEDMWDDIKQYNTTKEDPAILMQLKRNASVKRGGLTRRGSVRDPVVERNIRPSIESVFGINTTAPGQPQAQAQPAQPEKRAQSPAELPPSTSAATPAHRQSLQDDYARKGSFGSRASLPNVGPLPSATPTTRASVTTEDADDENWDVDFEGELNVRTVIMKAGSANAPSSPAATAQSNVAPTSSGGSNTASKDTASHAAEKAPAAVAEKPAAPKAARAPASAPAPPSAGEDDEVWDDDFPDAEKLQTVVRVTKPTEAKEAKPLTAAEKLSKYSEDNESDEWSEVDARELAKRLETSQSSSTSSVPSTVSAPAPSQPEKKSPPSSSPSTRSSRAPSVSRSQRAESPAAAQAGSPGQEALAKYRDREDDDDFSDLFGAGTVRFSAAAAKRLQERDDEMSWPPPADESEDEDPFAGLEEDFEDYDEEARILQDKHARLSAETMRLIGRLGTRMDEAGTLAVCNKLFEIFSEYPDQRYELIAHHGVIPMMDLLEVSEKPEILRSILKIVNLIVSDSPAIKDNFCMVGGIPAVVRFAAPSYDKAVRLEAAQFVQRMCQTETLQIFISCRGLPVLVELIGDAYVGNEELVRIGIECIRSVFELESVTPKNDFCRLFAKTGLLRRLTAIMLQMLEELHGAQAAILLAAGGIVNAGQSAAANASDKAPRKTSSTRNLFASRSSSSTNLMPGNLQSSSPSTEKKEESADEKKARALGSSVLSIAEIFLWFSHADSVVKMEMARPEVLQPLVSFLDLFSVSGDVLVTLLKAVKNVSMDPNTLDALQDAKTIPRLVKILDRRTGPLIKEMHNQVLNTLFNLCRLNRSRQEEAAHAGAMPPLRFYISRDNSPLRQLALQITFDIIGRRTTKAIKEDSTNNNIEMFVSLLRDPYWQVNAIDALAAWAMDDTKKAESAIGTAQNIKALVAAFAASKSPSLDRMGEPLHRMLLASESITRKLTAAGLMQVVLERLSNPRPNVRLDMLKLVGDMYHTSEHKREMMEAFGLPALCRRLVSADPAVLVREMASALVVEFDAKASKKKGLFASLRS